MEILLCLLSAVIQTLSEGHAETITDERTRMFFHACCLRGKKWIGWSNKEIAVYTILLGVCHRVLLADDVKPFLSFFLSLLFLRVLSVGPRICCTTMG